MGAAEIKREHDIKLFGRKEMSISGVREVVSFDEESVRLMSVEGEIYVEGVVTLTGKINGFYYVNEDKGEKKSFFSRLIH